MGGQDNQKKLQGLVAKSKTLMDQAKQAKEEIDRMLKEAQEQQQNVSYQHQSQHTAAPIKVTPISSTSIYTHALQITSDLFRQAKALESEDPNRIDSAELKKLEMNINQIGTDMQQNAELKKVIDNLESTKALEKKVNDLSTMESTWKKTKPEHKSRYCWPFSLCFSGEKKETDPEREPLLKNGRRYYSI